MNRLAAAVVAHSHVADEPRRVNVVQRAARLGQWTTQAQRFHASAAHSAVVTLVRTICQLTVDSGFALRTIEICQFEYSETT